MSAIHLMRIATGRERIIKVEGTYHGHHDAVEVSVYPDLEEAGPAGRPVSVRDHEGVPADVARLTVVVPFGDLDAVERAFLEYPDEIAGMIIEPVMMNIGIIEPPDGYLAGLRAICHRHGAFLTFDEVKTGFATAPGGMIERSGVVPDIVCLAKALGGGLPCGRHRRHQRDHAPHRRRPLRAGRHVQRQPAHDGRGPGHAARGAHTRRVRVARHVARRWCAAPTTCSSATGCPAT